MKKYPCSRCDGKGNIQGYKNVLGGICFKCGGSGLSKTMPTSKLSTFAVKGVVVADLGVLNAQLGDVGTIYNLKAKDETDAIAQAQIKIAEASASFRDSWCAPSLWSAVKL